MRLVRQHAVTGEQLARLAPPTRCTDEVIGRSGELRAPVAARLLDGELQEMVGFAVVEPVDDLAWHDTILLRVVGHHLDVHLVVDDLADLLARDRKSTRLNSSHVAISYAVFCLKKKTMIM